jgi:succinate dehydrogenase/fumarate reductase cytochrome b subunit (b558 family)
VALKALMAITGLVMIGFLLMHMYGNLKAFLGAEAFDHYAHWLKTDLLYPLLPQGWFIWIFRFALLACIVAHIYAAAVLTLRAHGARSTKYVTTDRIQQTYAARTMRWGGVIIVGFLVFHLLQFTVQVVTPGFTPGISPYEMVVAELPAVVAGAGLRGVDRCGVHARAPRRLERADDAGREHLSGGQAVPGRSRLGHRSGAVRRLHDHAGGRSLGVD